jgi:hypothetical protein
LTTAAACSIFRGKAICPLGFFPSRGLYRRRGIIRGGTRWSHHRWRGQGLGRAPWWWGWLLGPLRLIFSLCEASVKIGGSAFVLSNFANISCVTFLKHKIAENRELAVWHLVNRLVPENA